MTKNEIVALIRQKMKDAKLNCEIALAKREFDEYSWYDGIQRGLQDALQVIGMLDNEHNRLKSSLPTSYPSGANAQQAYRNKYDESLV
jgi:hypothetical protein